MCNLTVLLCLCSFSHFPVTNQPYSLSITFYREHLSTPTYIHNQTRNTRKVEDTFHPWNAWSQPLLKFSYKGMFYLLNRSECGHWQRCNVFESNHAKCYSYSCVLVCQWTNGYFSGFTNTWILFYIHKPTAVVTTKVSWMTKKKCLRCNTLNCWRKRSLL